MNKASMVPAPTFRLAFRRLQAADAAVFFQLNSIPAVVQYTARPALASLEAACKLLSSADFSQHDAAGFGRFAVLDGKTGAVIGLVGLRPASAEGISCAPVLLGFRFLPQIWGQGIASEAAAAVVQYVFRQLQLPAVAATVFAANKASQRVLAKLGFSLQIAQQTASADTDSAPALLTYYLAATAQEA